MTKRQIGTPILPVFGNINGGSSLTKSFFIKARTIKPTTANPPIIIKAYVKYSINVSKVTPVEVIV